MKLVSSILSQVDRERHRSHKLVLRQVVVVRGHHQVLLLSHADQRLRLGHCLLFVRDHQDLRTILPLLQELRQQLHVFLVQMGINLVQQDQRRTLSLGLSHCKDQSKSCDSLLSSRPRMNVGVKLFVWRFELK